MSSRYFLLGRSFRRLSTMTNTVLKPYPNYVERQVEVQINTTSGDDKVEIDRETKVQVSKPASFVRATVNYVDTNPLGDRNQAIVCLVHGYPGNHQSMRNLIEEFQRRNFRCIAPDMPCKTTTESHRRVSSLFQIVAKRKCRCLAVWCGRIPFFFAVDSSANCSNKSWAINSCKNIVRDAGREERLSRPIQTVVGMHENAYAVMSMADQYEYLRCQSLVLIDPTPRKLIRFFPLAKLVFDFGRLPLHWPMAKYLLYLLGYQEIIRYSQRDVMAALRIWLTEDTNQVEKNASVGKNIFSSSR